MNIKLDTCGSASSGTRARNTQYAIRNTKYGFVLPLVLIAMVILMALIIGATMTSYGSRLQAVQTKAQTEAMLAAEAGYEQAIFWMSQRTDLLGDIQAGGGEDSIIFETGRCDYEVGFHGFIGARPVFRVTSTGICGRPSFTRVVDVDVMQETSGWAMGACRVPSGTTSTTAVYFKNGEIVDMPLHINKANDSPDVADIFINTSNGSPQFLRKVEMGESRKNGATDKYAGVMTCFQQGIDFDQPGVRITDDAAVQSKVNRFRDSTNATYRYTPALASGYSPAVQLEFYVSGGAGYVKISNHCRVKTASPGSYDYSVVPGYSGARFQTYNIYAYHFRPTSGSLTYPIESTYVTQTIGGYTSDPGGQIYVNGNVVIGSADYVDMVVKGKITVVATGNIWIADSIVVDGGHTTDGNNMPTSTNPNVLGLIAQGVVKIVDPGQSSSPSSAPSGYTIARVCNGSSSSNDRKLPDPTIVEASITVGGGGFGAENVDYPSGRKEYSSPTDVLIVRGSLTEVIRGVVGLFNSSTGVGYDGYDKYYYIDTRLMSGILPGDIWFSGKYIPAPAGWHDHGLNH